MTVPNSDLSQSAYLGPGARAIASGPVRQQVLKAELQRVGFVPRDDVDETRFGQGRRAGVGRITTHGGGELVGRPAAAGDGDHPAAGGDAPRRVLPGDIAAVHEERHRGTPRQDVRNPREPDAFVAPPLARDEHEVRVMRLGPLRTVPLPCLVATTDQRRCDDAQQWKRGSGRRPRATHQPHDPGVGASVDDHGSGTVRATATGPGGSTESGSGSFTISDCPA